MHGRPRRAATDDESKAAGLKATKLRALQSQFLQFHHGKIYTKEALEVNAKLLENNPEYLTAWNYRKLAVDYRLSQPKEQVENDPEAVKSIYSDELKVTERALAKNYKSYGAWYHRKWVISKGHSSLDRELDLLKVFLSKDSRNFHAWNYWRFISALKNRSNEEELEFTTVVIKENFSNYSAWHNRSALLSNLLRNKVQGFSTKEKVLSEEYDFVHNALFTDPDDQSGWFYHLWLLNETAKVENPLLLSTWPSHGCNINVGVDNFLVTCDSSPFSSFNLKGGTIPLILYFSEAVGGVSSSTITVESVYNPANDLTWIPLSTNSSGSAQVWVAYLNVLGKGVMSSEAHSVKVSLGHSVGVVSLNGFPYGGPSCFEFNVTVQPCSSQSAERKSRDMISWKDTDFQNCETHLQDSSQVKLFGQLKIGEDSESAAYNWSLETIANEIELFREFLSESKIGKLVLARLLTAQDKMVSYGKSADTRQMVRSKEVLELYKDLITLDPSHSQYYKDEYSLVLLREMTSSPESLWKSCRQHRNPTSTGTDSCLFLRLSGLSLSRVGAFEKLLWVQRLDLSHNQLSSIEGLQAMQLVCCLNLSNNKIGSFSALEPLKLLKSLEVLNISYNEIGAHTVDARRYLCASPLFHTGGVGFGFGEASVSDLNLTNYVQAYSVLKDSKLIQIDVAGNAVADEKFKLFLVKILPGLKWLDGVEIH